MEVTTGHDPHDHAAPTAAQAPAIVVPGGPIRPAAPSRSGLKPTKAFVADPYLDLSTYDADADLMTLSLGPQHPSTHGVFRVVLYLDGEVIVKAVPYAGYLHRGVEKLCEKLTIANVTPIFDKNDYVAPMTNEQAVNMAFEKLMGIEVPLRSKYLRTILAETQRVASHLLWLGTFAMDLGGALGGGASVFMWCFREREMILDVFEALTGCRFHYNTHMVGGNRHDLPADWPKLLHETLAAIDDRLDQYLSTVEHPIFLDRTKGVGVIDGELALELGLSGPLLRASGVDHDLRRDAPYHIYDQVDLRVFVEDGGDCLARAKVRILEMRESIRISRMLVDNVPVGPISSTKPVRMVGQHKIAQGQAYVGIETPRGELGTYLIGGGDGKGASPYRLKIRPPSFHAAAVIPYILPGLTLSDAIAVLGSLDPIMGEVDR
ncbi:MAG: NADH-quinone oxidoreductase subunit D [Deltaproteobacteria bacterium]|nr:NADH-quinone oxidoreductase subunit D [Deltaproteobacteria bacterium]